MHQHSGAISKRFNITRATSLTLLCQFTRGPRSFQLRQVVDLDPWLPHHFLGFEVPSGRFKDLPSRRFQSAAISLQKESSRTKEIPANSNVTGELPIKITGWLFDIMGSGHPAYMKLIMGTTFKLSEWVSTRPPVTFKLTFRPKKCWLFAKPRHIDIWVCLKIG